MFKKNINNQAPSRSLLRESLIFIWELVKVIIISLVIIIPIRYFLIQPFYVKGASMMPNFLDHEYLIIDEISYRFRQPERGEVVVFRYPLNPKEYFIKRVIGLPGEKIEIKQNQITIYNQDNPEGFALNEPYLINEGSVQINKTVILNDDEYFLLGDNRAESLDSRFFGSVNKKLIVGRVFFRGWPFNKIGFFLEAPVYNN